MRRDQKQIMVSIGCQSASHVRTNRQTNGQQESILVHFSLKCQHLVAIILINFFSDNQLTTHFYYLLVAPGFLPPRPFF